MNLAGTEYSFIRTVTVASRSTRGRRVSWVPNFSTGRRASSGVSAAKSSPMVLDRSRILRSRSARSAAASRWLSSSSVATVGTGVSRLRR